MTLHMQDACTFDLLVYTDNNVDVPQTWEESDPKYINNQQVGLSMGFGCLFVERALNMTLYVCVCVCVCDFYDLDFIARTRVYEQVSIGQGGRRCASGSERGAE